MTRISLVLRAYVELIAYDWFMLRHDFLSLHCRVKGFAIRSANAEVNGTEVIASSLDVACCFYPRPTLCLQRSAVLVKMLRRDGIPAQMVIGAQKLPFKAHAWVEVNGQIIHDRLTSQEKFPVLEVC